MANAATRLFMGAAPTARTVIYTAPAATKAVVTEIFLTNTTDVNVVVSLGIAVPPAAGFDVVNDVSVPANGYMQIGLKQVLNIADTLDAIAGAAGVNIFVSGVEIT